MQYVDDADVAERSILEEELEWMRVHGGTEYGDATYAPTASKRYGSDESGRGRVTSGAFTPQTLQDVRARQTAQRREAQAARERKAYNENDAAAVAYIVAQTPSDAL